MSQIQDVAEPPVLYQEQRFSYILNKLDEHAVVRVSELAQQLSVSEATIRKDIRALEQVQKLKRTHGGAVKLGGMQEMRLEAARIVAHEEKVRIGRLAAQFVEDGETLCIQSGTTTMEFARALRGRRHLTVLTSDMQIAMLLETILKDSTIVMLGGEIRAGYHYAQGSETLKQISRYHVGCAFLCANSFSFEGGFTAHHVEQANYVRSQLEISDKRIMLIDSSKYNHTAFLRAVGWEDIHVLITDDGFPETARQDLIVAYPHLDIRIA